MRGFCCIVSERKECDEYHGTECAHIRTPGNGGMGRKPSDVFIIPACRIHHHLMHSIGDAEFERRYGVDLVAKALEIASASPVKEIKEAAKAHLAIPAAYQNHNLRKWLRGDDGWPTIPPKNIR